MHGSLEPTAEVDIAFGGHGAHGHIDHQVLFLVAVCGVGCDGMCLVIVGECDVGPGTQWQRLFGLVGLECAERVLHFEGEVALCIDVESEVVIALAVLVESAVGAVGLHPSAEGERCSAECQLALGGGGGLRGSIEAESHIVSDGICVQHALDDEVIDLVQALAVDVLVEGDADVVAFAQDAVGGFGQIDRLG